MHNPTEPESCTVADSSRVLLADTLVEKRDKAVTDALDTGVITLEGLCSDPDREVFDVRVRVMSGLGLLDTAITEFTKKKYINVFLVNSEQEQDLILEKMKGALIVLGKKYLKRLDKQQPDPHLSEVVFMDVLKRHNIMLMIKGNSKGFSVAQCEKQLKDRGWVYHTFPFGAGSQ